MRRAMLLLTTMLVAIGVVFIAGLAVAATGTGAPIEATATNATIEATAFSVGPNGQTGPQTGEAFARCPGTKRALGGGVVESGAPNDLFVHASGVTANTNDGDIAKQWYAAVFNDDAVARNFKVFAICE